MLDVMNEHICIERKNAIIVILLCIVLFKKGALKQNDTSSAISKK